MGTDINTHESMIINTYICSLTNQGLREAIFRKWNGSNMSLQQVMQYTHQGEKARNLATGPMDSTPAAPVKVAVASKPEPMDTGDELAKIIRAAVNKQFMKFKKTNFQNNSPSVTEFCKIHKARTHSTEQCWLKDKEECICCEEKIKKGEMVDHIDKCKAPRCHSCNWLGHKLRECCLRFLKHTNSKSKDGPQAKKTVNVATTESENKTEEAKSEWLHAAALLDKQPGSPLFIPKIGNSMSIEELWDTGAWFSLVDSQMVSSLIHNGAEHKQLEKPITLQGVGGRSVMSTHALHTTLTFDDNKPWPIKCYVVPECPWPIIIGQPFMTEHKIAALITQNEGLKLYDFISTEKIKILTIHKPTPQNPQPATTPNSVFIPMKILTAQEIEAQKADYDKWRSMLNDDMKDLVDLLLSIKFMTSKVTDKQLRKAG